MTDINFKKIAIFDRRSVNTPDLNSCSNDTLSKLIKSWEKTALNRGMEACYFRIYNLDKEKFYHLIESMDSDVPIIAPASQMLKHARISGFHYKEAENPTIKDRFQIYGKSCHSLESIIEAQNNGIDYVFFSPIFETKSHPDAEGVGLEKLQEICEKSQIPVYALGGINENNYQECLEAGAYGFGAISMFMGGSSR